MVAVNTFMLGNTCYIDVQSARAEVGDTAVVADVQPCEQADNTADVVVFENAADATLLSKHVRAKAAGDAGVETDVLGPDVIRNLMTRCRREIKQAAKRSFDSRFSSKWMDLFAKPGAHHDPPPPLDPLVGKVVNVTASVQYDDQNAAAAELYSGRATVAKTHPIIPNMYVLSVAAAGDGAAGAIPASRFVWLSKEVIVAKLAAEATSEVQVSQHAKTLYAYELVKALPGSQALDGVDATELIEVAASAGVDTTDMKHDANGISFMLVACLQGLQFMLQRKEGARLRLWPTNAKRLGEAIKRFAATPAAPVSALAPAPAAPLAPQFPLSEGLKSALSAQLDDDDACAGLAAVRAYVAESCPNPAQQKRIVESDYVASGAIEHFLKKAGHSAESLSRADLASLDKVEYFCFQATDSGTAPSAAAGKGPQLVMPPINVIPHAADATEEESRYRSVLRADASALLGDTAAVDRLIKYKSYSEAGDVDKLRSEIELDPSPSLHRLCTSHEALHKALAGAYKRRAKRTRDRVMTRAEARCAEMEAAMYDSDYDEVLRLAAFRRKRTIEAAI
jgi:hypothetical protein